MAVTFPSDLEIARKARLLPMNEVASKMGIGPHLLEPYGHDVAKIRLEAIDELADRPKAKYVVVSASPRRLWAKARRRPQSASARRFRTSASGPPSPSVSPRWAPRSASRAGRRAEATARSCRWSA